MFLLPIYRYTKEELDNRVQQKADAEIYTVQGLSGTMSKMLCLQNQATLIAETRKNIFT